MNNIHECVRVETWKRGVGVLGRELWSGICNTSKSNGMEVSSLMGRAAAEHGNLRARQ